MVFPSSIWMTVPTQLPHVITLLHYYTSNYLMYCDNNVDSVAISNTYNQQKTGTTISSKPLPGGQYSHSHYMIVMAKTCCTK